MRKLRNLSWLNSAKMIETEKARWVKVGLKRRVWNSGRIGVLSRTVCEGSYKVSYYLSYRRAVGGKTAPKRD